MGNGQDKTLQSIADRLHSIETRLDSLDRCLENEADLRRKLEGAEQSRTQLADQAAHLLEQLSETRSELRQYWDQDKRDKAEGRG